jgi:hypothetical protein
MRFSRRSARAAWEVWKARDIGKQDGIDFMVLEHPEGEMPTARVTKGPLPLDRVLRYATCTSRL